MERPCFGYTIRYAPNRFGAKAQAVSAGPIETWELALRAGNEEVERLHAQGHVIITMTIQNVRLAFPQD